MVASVGLRRTTQRRRRFSCCCAPATDARGKVETARRPCCVGFQYTQRADFVIVEDIVDARKSNRPLAGPGDDVGAAELGRRVAENLRQRLKARCLSLDDLARSSGVSRAALSQIETCKSNPTVGVLWKIAVGLGLPIAELIGAPRSGVGGPPAERLAGPSFLRRQAREPAADSCGLIPPRRALRASPLIAFDARVRGARTGHPRAPRRAQRPAQDARRRRRLRARRGRPRSPSRPTSRTSTKTRAGSEARYHNVIVYER